jgi:hypothetical protein
VTQFAVYPLLESETAVVAWEYEYGDVRRFGAVGNGVVNDRTAIANADAAVAAAKRGAVYFPPGFICAIRGRDLTIVSPVVFDSMARVKPARGVTVTFNGPVSTTDAQHFDLADGGAVQPRSSFRRFISAYGDAFDVFTIGEAGGTHPILGEFDFSFGEKERHLRRFEWNMAGPAPRRFFP